MIEINDINRHQLIGKVNFPTLTWDDVIFNLNKNVLEEDDYKILPNLGFVTHHTRHLRKVCDVGMEIQKLFPTNYITSHLYFSLLEISKTFGKHNDYQHVFYWQCIGITEWTVWDKEEYVYNLMPGEIIYVPAGMDHSTKPITPRAGISFGIELYPPPPPPED